MTMPAVYVPAPVKVLFDGQSLQQFPSWGLTPLQKTMAQLPASWRAELVAVGGTPYATRAADAARRVDTRVPFDGTVTVLVDIAGQSDLWNGASNLTAAQTLAAMESYADARKAAGVDFYVMCTVPPSTIYNADDETQRNALNVSIRSSSHWDAVADLAAIAAMSNPSNGTYWSDGLHETEAGAVLFGAEIATAIGTLDL